MKSLVRRDSIRPAGKWLLLGIFLTCLPHGSATAAGSPVSPNHTEDARLYRSIFIDDPAFGRDPFFPNSKRREGRAVQPTPSVTPTNQYPMEVLIEGLELKGISLGATKKLAIISNYTFAEGEERNVKVGHQSVEVRCISIQERSVSIIVNGRTRKELNLRDGI